MNMGEAAEELNENQESQEAVNTVGGEEEAQADAKILEIARAVGWKEDGPMSAEEFLKSMPERFHNQTKEMKQLRRSVEGMAKTFKTTVEAQYQKGIRDAETRMAQAKAEMDIDAYEQARTDRDNLRQAQSTEPQLLPEVEEFISRNEWFDKDKAMTADALIYKKNYLEANPGAPIEDVLDYVERRIKRDYPDHFKAKTPEEKKTATPPSPEGSRGTNKPLAQWEKDKALLSPLEKEMMTLQCATEHNGKPLMSEQKFIEMLRQQGVFEGRK